MTSSTPASHRSLPWLLAGLSMIGPFSIDAVFPAFPLVAAHFHVDTLALQQLVSIYLLAYGSMSLFHGAISDAIGRRPVIIGGMLVYALASLGAATASSYAMLLACRGLQGACAGAGLVVGRAVVRDVYEGPQAQQLMSRVMIIFSIAPVIAPMVGAQLLWLGGWHGIFWLLVVFSAVLAGLLWRLLRETHPPERRTRFAFGSLLGTYAAFGRDAPFWPLLVASSVNFAGLFLYIASAPYLVRNLLGLSAQGFPWVFLPVVSGLAGGAWLSGRLAERRGVRYTVNLGYVLMLGACALHMLAGWLCDPPRLPWSMLPLVLQGLGVQLAFPTLTLLLLDRFPQQRGSASSVQAFTSLILNAGVAGLMAPWLQQRMLSLALGASVLTVVGWLAWCVYARQVRQPPAFEALPARDTTLQAEIVEPH